MTDPNVLPETPPPADVASGSPAPSGGLNVPGLVALILAAVAFLTAIVPVASFSTWLFAIAAIVLAIIGLTRKGKGKGLAIAAIIIAPVAWLIAIIVSIVVIASGAGSAIDEGFQEGLSPQTQAPVTEETDETTPEPVAAEPTIGDAVTNNKGVVFTVTGVTCGIATAGDGFITSDAKGQFCQVTMTLDNGSDEAVDVFASDFTGEIGGAEYEADTTTTTFDDEYFTTTVNPGLSSTITAYFDVPADKTLEYLVYNPIWSFFDGDVRVKVS